MNDKIKAHFVANAGLKDIVGRGLIYNDNVAIIELVKNSKDAGSRVIEIELNDVNVDVKELNKKDIDGSFINLYNPEIIIKDYGKGMTSSEIKQKWLNIAYSEKKNVRNRGYAGNKGVGRFSCDRLGKTLTLYTKSKYDSYLKLIIDWTLYENKGERDEISSIPLTIHILEESDFLTEIGETSFDSGTVLKISGLRAVWKENTLKKLLSELEKFSPSLDHDFEIYMKSNMFFKNEELTSKLNSKVDNGILEKLKIKTIYIKSSIDEKGKYIETELYYQGEIIYKYKSINPYSSLSNISMEIHYLDTISKSYFTRNIGINPNNYGSIFLFYNGFRISPYGNEKNDWLNLDQRKSQGVSRNLGTRELFGRVTIKDNSDKFSVITSREGLVHNTSYHELIAYDYEDKVLLNNNKKEYGYITAIIRQLETFVVSGLEWNRLVDTLNEKTNISAADAEKNPERYIMKELSKEKVETSLKNLVSNKFEVVDYKINTKLILDMQSINKRKYDEYLNDFFTSIADTEYPDLPNDKKIQTQKIIKELKKQKEQAILQQREFEKVADEAIKQKIIVSEKLKTETRRSSFLERLANPEKTLDALITHVIQQISGGIEKDARSILSAYYESPDLTSKEDLVDVLEHAVIDISTIKETANMATKADFNLKIASVEDDLYGFIGDYINKVVSKSGKWGVLVNFENENNLSKIISFKPAEVCVLFVNLLENASKAEAKNLLVKCEYNKITFIDDGVGFDFERMSASDYLKKGITTKAGGSGLGLFHCSDISLSLGAKLIIDNNDDAGSNITLEF